MSNFKPGDLVEYLDDKAQGKIVSIIDRNKVIVEIDGLEIPVFKSELINLSEDNNNDEITISLGGNSDKKSYVNRKSTALYLGIQSEENQVSYHLINDTSYQVLYTFYLSDSLNPTPLLKGEVNNFSTINLNTIDTRNIDGFPLLTLQMLLYDENKNEIPEPLQFSYQLKGRQLLKQKSKLPLLDKEGYITQIFPPVIQEEKMARPIEPKPLKNEDIQDFDKPSEVIDLHIDKINENHRMMSRSEIFEFQFQYFQTSLEKAMALNYSKIIFIHGIGVSSLKNKILEHLKKDSNIKYFKEANVREFGFGATEVVLR